MLNTIVKLNRISVKTFQFWIFYPILENSSKYFSEISVFLVVIKTDIFYLIDLIFQKKNDFEVCEFWKNSKINFKNDFKYTTLWWYFFVPATSCEFITAVDSLWNHFVRRKLEMKDEEMALAELVSDPKDKQGPFFGRSLSVTSGLIICSNLTV